MTEFWLFIIVGAIAVVAAVMMLLSDNAVYSALFLIVTMACIAFLFILLNAPFLAMIQITVYAGAIMVLFIFVIMLLGAERLGSSVTKYRWLTPVAVALSAAFLLVAGLAIASGKVDLQASQSAPPLVRVLNLAQDSGAIGVYVVDTPLAQNLEYGEASDFRTVASGDVSIGVAPANGESFTGTFTLGPGTSQTLVAYTTGVGVTLSIIPTDLNTLPDRTARVTFFDAYPDAPSVNLVDLGSNGQLDFGTGGVLIDRVLLEDLQPGEVSQALEYPEGDVFWAFVTPNGDIVGRVVGDNPAKRSYPLTRETTDLMVLAPQISPLNGAVRPAVSIFRDATRPSFGGPQSIGLDLFARFLLPFEMVSLLLLAAMVGAIVLTHKEEARVRDRSALRRRVSRPLASVIAAQVGHDVTEPKETRPTLPPTAESQSPAGD